MAKLAFALAIMAGGSSSRMGDDKAFLDAGRGPNLIRLAQLGLTLQMPVLVIGREQPAHWPLPDVVFLQDNIPGQGPLGGVVAALQYADTILCLACDYFSLELEGVLWLRNQAGINKYNQPVSSSPGVVTRHAAGIEPLFACYTPHCRVEAERRLQVGERALFQLIQACDMLPIDAPP
jgi:molybdopterin-guanine dinucleotide biosynthesis protein A